MPPCNVCGKDFTSRWNMLRHKESKHSTEDSEEEQQESDAEEEEEEEDEDADSPTGEEEEDADEEDEKETAIDDDTTDSDSEDDEEIPAPTAVRDWKFLLRLGQSVGDAEEPYKNLKAGLLLFLEVLEGLRKDPVFKRIRATQQTLIEAYNGTGKVEAWCQAVAQRKMLLKRMVNSGILDDDESEMDHE